MLIKIGGQWINPSHIVKLSLENQNIILLLSTGEKVIQCSHSDFAPSAEAIENGVSPLYEIKSLDMKTLLDHCADYINSSWFDKDEGDECTCEQYGYCKVCNRETARPEHLFKTEGETK
jgi:hypothetical protein